MDANPFNVKKLNFNGLDNTLLAVVITVHCLVEREQMQSIHRNRYRNVEEVNPDIERLPMSPLPNLAHLIESPTRIAGQWAASNPDVMDVDGSVHTASAQAQNRRAAPKTPLIELLHKTTCHQVPNKTCITTLLQAV